MVLVVAALSVRTIGQVTCTVTTAAQLQDVLNCIAADDCDECAVCDGTVCPSHIIIPESAVIRIGDEVGTIGLGPQHSGLRLTINGTFLWEGEDTGVSQKLLQLTDADDITIDSTVAPSGRFTSEGPLQPCTINTPNCPGSAGYDELPVAIRIVGDCDNVTIRDLRCDHLVFCAPCRL